MGINSVVKITNLVKEFKNIRAVDNLSLDIEKGVLFGFLGPNGAGKSTTIRIILSLIRASSGKIELFGNEINHRNRAVFKRIGALVERPDFYNYLSAEKNLEIFGRMSGADSSKKNLYKYLDLVGLGGREKDKVKTYSMGMKQRLGIAQAIIHNPDLLILDEPTNGLDPMGMKEIRDLLIDLVENQGKTVFISSHILKEVESMATDVAIINKGRTIVEGKVDELLSSTKMKVIFKFEDNNNVKNIIKNTVWEQVYEESNLNMNTFNISKDSIPELVNFLSEKGAKISSVVPMNTLENYFIQVTGAEND